MAYTVFEETIAEQIIAELQERLDLYFGVEAKGTLGEVRVRGIALYEKKTFKTLLEFYTEKMIYTKNDEYTLYGRKQITSAEFRNITSQVSVQIKLWLRYYDTWRKQNPQVVVSDITGKRSKVLKYLLIIQTQWVDVKGIVQEELRKLKQQYRAYIIYSFTSATERAKIEEEYPKQLFLDLVEFQKQLRENMLARIGKERKISYDLLDQYIAWVAATTEEDSSRPIRYSNVPDQSKPSVISHHQAWIDYLTLQVFGDRGYLFGLERENVPLAIALGNQPSLSDFQDFMYARAISEAHRSELGAEDDYRHRYSPSDVELVAALNKRAIDNALHRYQSVLRDSGIEDPDDKFVGSAFNYKIPDEEILKRIEERILGASESAISTFGTRAKDEDIANHVREEGEEEARQYGIDPSFVDPYVEEGVNNYNDVAAAVEKAKEKAKDKVEDRSEKNNSVDNSVAQKKETKDTSSPKRKIPANTIISQNTEIIDPKRPNSTVVSTASSGNSGSSRENATTSEPAAVSITYKSKKAIEKSKRTIKKPKITGDVATQFIPTYRTFSGHDMVVTVQLPLSRTSYITKVIGAFQTVTYSIHNDKSPIRVLGNMNAKGYVFGPRTIAGSIHLTVFDRHWMRELLSTYKKIKSETERYFLADELPAFNIIISCANEYGHDAKLAIYGITIVNEGQVMSINDVYTENTYEFFATNVDYLDRVDQSVGSSNKGTANLPIKGQTPNSDDTITYKIGNDSDTTVTVTTSDPASDAGIEGAKNLDKYDISGEREKYIAALQDVVKNTDKNDPAQRKAAADKINALEKAEIYRRTQLWLNKIYYPKLAELEKNHADGNITDENYKQLRSIYIDSMVLNQKVIVSGESILADEYRKQLGVTYEDGENTIKDLFPEEGTGDVEIFEPTETTVTTPVDTGTMDTPAETKKPTEVKPQNPGDSTSANQEVTNLMRQIDTAAAKGDFYPLVMTEQDKTTLQKIMKGGWERMKLDEAPIEVQVIIARYPYIVQRAYSANKDEFYSLVLKWGIVQYAQEKRRKQVK